MAVLFKNNILLFLSLSLTSCQSPSPQYPFSESQRHDVSSIEAVGTQFAISTQGIFATQAAEKMYALHGNIMDATVAASFVVSVERPQSTGIGGGGFLIFRSETGKTYAVDFRERAPRKSTADMYVESGVVTKKSQDGILAVGTPGLVAGLLELHKKFGSLPLPVVLQPAIDLAENGFPIYPRLFEALQARAEILRLNPDAKKIFLDSQGNAPAVGTLLVQKDLAKTLQTLSTQGAASFYTGSLSKKIVQYMQEQKGRIQASDLKAYQVKWRQPLLEKYKNYQVVAMPPPSSGGLHVMQFLKFLETENLGAPLSSHAIHMAASALQFAFADRATYLGDPDFTKVPIQKLLSSDYISLRRKNIDPLKAQSSENITAGQFSPRAGEEHTETTHISIMDSRGNAISTTQTINGWMGSGVVVPGTGIVLNNEMDDFSAQTGSSNLYGAIGGTANAIQPFKTPLSSMSPTLLLEKGQPILALGAPGGTRIISCVAQTILNYIHFQLPLRDSVSMVRYHHQWKPDILVLEPPGPSRKTVQELKTMGYSVELKGVPCNVMAVAREKESFRAVADPRDIGTAKAR